MRSLLLASCVFLLACGRDDPPTAPTIDPALVGTWRVRTVNGQPLPYVESQSGSSRTTLDEGQITTTIGGTFSQQMDETTTSPGIIRIHLGTDYGLVTVDGGLLTFHYAKAGGTGTGTLSHDTLMVVQGSLSMALTR